MQLAAPRWCPGEGGLCGYCRKPEADHAPPERLCTGLDPADRYRQMGAALEASAQRGRAPRNSPS